jgi:hypothetical protein
MVWSAMSMAAEVELDFAIADDVLRKGTMKFFWLRAPLDVCFLPEDLRAEAHLLDPAPETGVACTVEFFLDAGNREWKMARVWVS